MIIKFESSDLLRLGVTDEQFSKVTREFLESLKGLLASQITKTYGVNYSVSKGLVKIRIWDYTRFEVGVIPPNSYSNSQMEIISRIQKIEYGATSVVQGRPMIRTFCDDLSEVIGVLWIDFISTYNLRMEEK